jgi:RNA polymerase sigma-70 factor (ECF subfamily)
VSPAGESDGPGSDTARIGGLVEGLFRRSAARIVASLARKLGVERLDVAEEAVQDALVRALETWPHRGVPGEPEAWLTLVARNRALDILRRDTAHERVVEALRAEPSSDDRAGGADDELRLLLLCLHPALTPRARVALALKTVGGFGVNEIARALLARPDAIAQLLVRAKRTIRAAGLSFDLPQGADLAERVEGALDTIYLLFNEGYAATDGPAIVRVDVCAAAIRFGQLLVADRATEGPEAHALLALMCLQASRLTARTGPDGELRPLAEQDRSRWDPALVAAGFRHLDRAATGDRLTHWHVEAAIASCHAVAMRSEETDWARILALYDQLLELKPSPIVRLNRAVAVGRVDGPAAALRELEAAAGHPALAGYPLLPAIEASFLTDLGRHDQAAAALDRALALARTEPEARLLEERKRRLRPGPARGRA